MAPVILEPRSILLQGWWLWLTLLGLRFPSVKRESHITDVSWALIAYLSTGVGFPPSLQTQAQATPLGWLYPPLWVWLFSVTFREEIYPERAILWLMSQATQLIPHHSFSHVSQCLHLISSLGNCRGTPLPPSPSFLHLCWVTLRLPAETHTLGLDSKPVIYPRQQLWETRWTLQATS